MTFDPPPGLPAQSSMTRSCRPRALAAPVRAGQTLRIVDLEGNQAVDFLLYAAADDAERYSAQDTIAASQHLPARRAPCCCRTRVGR
jgi:uncharacterized protein YcgI (DUF1989 family)